MTCQVQGGQQDCSICDFGLCTLRLMRWISLLCSPPPCRLLISAMRGNVLCLANSTFANSTFAQHALAKAFTVGRAGRVGRD